MKKRASSDDASEESARRYCARRSSTFPVVGPCMAAIKRPYSVNHVTKTPSLAQCSSRYWLHEMRPKQAMDWSVCRGILPRVFPARRSSTHSPSFESHVSCVVTKRVFRWRFMAAPHTVFLHRQRPFHQKVAAYTRYAGNRRCSLQLPAAVESARLPAYA